MKSQILVTEVLTLHMGLIHKPQYCPHLQMISHQIRFSSPRYIMLRWSYKWWYRWSSERHGVANSNIVFSSKLIQTLEDPNNCHKVNIFKLNSDDKPSYAIIWNAISFIYSTSLKQQNIPKYSHKCKDSHTNVWVTSLPLSLSSSSLDVTSVTAAAAEYKT